MALLTIENLNFTYPNASKKSLSGISFSINDGDFVLLAGSSGCGKSTLLRQFKTELAPHGNLQGTISYKGINLKELEPRIEASEIGFVMQNPQNQIVTDKVWHELAFGLENIGISSDEIRVRVCEMASYFGINSWFDKSTNELSGGQMQLLNLASVLAMQPKILLLDEPTSQLDPIAASDFIETLKKLNRDLGLTILIAEHHLEELFPVANQVLIMEDSKLILNGTPQEIAAALNDDKYDKLAFALPTPLRVFRKLKLKSDLDCPLTVREGRQFLSHEFVNPSIKSIAKAKNNIKQKIVMSLEDCWFRYEKDEPDVLKGISLRINEGEILSIVGANGAGKTTLLSLLSRVIIPNHGKVMLNGKNIKSYKSNELYRNNIAQLPQNPQTIFVMDTVLEDLIEVCDAMHFDKAQAKKKIDEVIAIINIQELLKMHPYDLSGGEQQKAALAKILLLNPKILLLDEPTKGLDAYAKDSLASILKRLAANKASVVIVTHDIDFSASYCDRCAMFFNGEIISEGIPSDFYSNNSFYTTSASKMSRHIFDGAVTCEDVITLCKKNQKENV